MKLIKTFSQPILLAVVWLIGIRPATYLIDTLMPNKVIPATVKGTIDIAIISSLIAYLFSLWKKPIEIETKLINFDTLRSHSNCNKGNGQVTLKVNFKVLVNVKNSNWINWSEIAQKFGGIYIGMKENSLISHELDSKISCSLIKEHEDRPYIHLFDKHFEISEPAELEYVLYYYPNTEYVKTLEMKTNIETGNKGFFKRFIGKLFISIFIKGKHDKHPVYIN